MFYSHLIILYSRILLGVSLEESSMKDELFHLFQILQIWKADAFVYV